jgi:hypothetical protein
MKKPNSYFKWHADMRQFQRICGELFIDPGLALENDDLCDLIRAGVTAEEVRAFMLENF